MQRSPGLVGVVYGKCVPDHCARIPEPGGFDKLHMQLGVGAPWITKNLDFLVGNPLQRYLRLDYLFFSLLLRDGRQPTVRHRMSAYFEIPAYVSDLLRSQ